MFLPGVIAMHLIVQTIRINSINEVIAICKLSDVWKNPSLINDMLTFEAWNSLVHTNTAPPTD